MGCKNTKSLPKTGCDELPPSPSASPSAHSTPRRQSSLPTSVRSDDGDSISRIFQQLQTLSLTPSLTPTPLLPKQNVPDISLSNKEISIGKVVSKQQSKQQSKQNQTERERKSHEEYEKEPTITQEIIAKRVIEKEPYPCVPHLLGKVEISFVKIDVSIIIHYCPIIQNTNTSTSYPITYQNDYDIGKKMCKKCGYRKSQHVPRLQNSVAVTPVRMYVCSICNNTPKDLVVDYLSKNTPPMYNGKFVCIACYFRQHGREPPAHFLE